MNNSISTSAVSSCKRNRSHSSLSTLTETEDVLTTASRYAGAELVFRPVTHKDMPLIWEYLSTEKGRTTDFSYCGLLMWVEYFHYEYAIFEDTLFIKGRLEDDVDKIAFSHPVGKLPTDVAVGVLKAHCERTGDPLEFSAVPEYALNDYLQLSPTQWSELPDWADYLYDAGDLATLKGKKFNKKRNHVHQFVSAYPDWRLELMTENDVDKGLAFMNEFEKEGDNTFMAIKEREATCSLLRDMHTGDPHILSVALYAGEEMAAFTVGDIKGDTLFIHVEKALRRFAGSYEMINNKFAEFVLTLHPEIRYINREDDSGDEGLRQAKESYRPVAKLKKYNIIF